MHQRYVQEEYMKLRKLQKRAREEMWHVFSHHEDLEEEWNRPYGGCLSELKRLLEWEPEENE